MQKERITELGRTKRIIAKYSSVKHVLSKELDIKESHICCNFLIT